MSDRRLRFLSWALFLALLAAASVRADTFTYTGTFSFPSPPGPETDLSQLFPLFYDPGYALTGVALTVDGSMTGHGSITSGAGGGAGAMDIYAAFYVFDPRVTTSLGSGVEAFGAASWSNVYGSSTAGTYDSGPQTATTAGHTLPWSSSQPDDLANFVGTAAGQSYSQYVAVMDDSSVYTVPLLPGSVTGFAQVDSATADVTLTYTYGPAPVPEPATLSLFGLGLGLLGFLRRRR
jgi:hypothetical protein